MRSSESSGAISRSGWLELGALLALMALPVGLVIADRWLNERPQLQWLPDLAGSLIHQVESLGLPGYIALVLACLLGLLALALLAAQPTPLSSEFLIAPPTPPSGQRLASRRQQRASGWLLGLSALAAAWLSVRAVATDKPLGLAWGLAALGILLGILFLQVPWRRAQAAWRKQAGPWSGMALGLLGLLALLASLYSDWLPAWLTAALFGLACLNLWRLRSQLPAAYWLVLGALVLWSRDINAWWLVAVGDEYAFYREARFIAFDAPWALIAETFFKGNFVYSAHPFLSTLLQAVFLKIFGDGNFAWRMSSLFYPALSLLFFDYFLRTFLKTRYAFIVTFLLAISHYLAAFGKVGYNNLQALLAFSLVLAATAWVIRSHNPAASLALGLAQAFCLYVYPAALYVVPLPFLLLLLYDPPWRRGAAHRWALTLGALVLLLLPLLLQPLYWESKIAGTLAYTPTLTDTSATALSHFSSNFLYTLLSPLFAIEERHFIAVGYLDPLSAMLSFFGLALLLVSAWRQRFLVFALLAFSLVFFLCGLSHDRQFPPGTRMFLLLPFLALFCALAVAWFKLQLNAVLKFNSHSGRIVLAGVGLLLLALNAYQAHSLAYQRMTGYQNFEGLFLRTSQALWQAHPQANIIVVHQPEILHLTSLQEILAIYQVPYQPTQLVSMTPADLETVVGQRLAAEAQTLLLVDERLPQADLLAIGARLEALGKDVCPVQHAQGHTRLYLWHSAPLADQCPPLILPEG